MRSGVLGFGAGIAVLVSTAAAPQTADPDRMLEPDERLALDTALGLPTALDFDASADGRRVVLAAAVGRSSRLFLAAAGAEPAALTSGRRWDSAPRFLADGLSVVFVSGPRPRGREPESGRLFRLSLGGEPTPLADPGLLVRAPAVAPDGERIAFLGRRIAGDEPDPDYDLWLVPAEGGEPERWTRHPGDEGPPAWSPDGRRLAYAFADPDGRSRGLAVVSTEGPGPHPPLTLVSGARGPVRGEPGWTPDGSGVVFAAPFRPETADPEVAAECPASCAEGVFAAIHHRDARGAGPAYPLLAVARDLSEPRFRPLSPPEETPETAEIAWIEAAEGSRRIHRSALRRGADGRWRLSGRRRVVTRGAGVRERIRWTRDGSRLVALHQAAAFPRDVWTFPVEGGRRRISDTLFPEIDVRSFSRPEYFEVESPDGVRVGAFLYRPVPESEGESGTEAPLLVHVRGPAGTAWENGFDPVVQLLAAEGFAVVIPNVRGASGRGEAFAASNDGDWGGGDLADLVAVTRAARRLPGVSEDDACIFGVEYGGFLALAALARHPDLFDCGVETMGTADLWRLHRTLAPHRRRALEDEIGPLRGNLERYRRLSLTGEGAAIRAPLLSFHGEQVPEVPLEAKEAFLAELRARPEFPLVELYFRGDTGRSVFRPETDRGAAYAWLAKVLEFLSVHLPVSRERVRRRGSGSDSVCESAIRGAGSPRGPD